MLHRLPALFRSSLIVFSSWFGLSALDLLCVKGNIPLITAWSDSNDSSVTSSSVIIAATLIKSALTYHHGHDETSLLRRFGSTGAWIAMCRIHFIFTQLWCQMSSIYITRICCERWWQPEHEPKIFHKRHRRFITCYCAKLANCRSCSRRRCFQSAIFKAPTIGELHLQYTSSARGYWTRDQNHQ